MTMSSAVPASNGGGGGIPSLLDIRVPRPPHLNNSYSRPPPPQAISPPMAVFPSYDQYFSASAKNNCVAKTSKTSSETSSVSISKSDCSNSPNFVQANKIGVSANPLRSQ